VSELDDDTLTEAGVRHDMTGKLQVLVVGDGIFATHRVPSSGQITIGRGDRCTVRIDAPAVSREHAMLVIGDTLTVRDLGSRNGTRVGKRLLQGGEEMELAMGDPVQIGSALVMVQKITTPPSRRRVRSHDYFEGRVDEQCARSARSGAPFAVLRIKVDAGVRSAAEVLFGVLREHDVLAEYAPDEYEIMIDAGPADVEAISDRASRALGKEGIGHEMGVAMYPRDGTTVESLVAAAEPLHPSREDEPAAGTMGRLRALMECVAKSDISVLVQGETGVGKEVMARAIHRASPRADRTFLGLSCAALSESLLEAELFGYERGAFTGATQSKPGLLESAQGGTLFLDELGELSLTTQAKLLRVLEERQVLRVGSVVPRPIDVRIVSATHRDLEEEIARGRFRQDLYFRLNGVTLVIPPLRERLDEIDALARSFLERVWTGPTPPVISDAARRELLAYAWPGNIRELRNVMERAALLCRGKPVLPEHLPLDKMHARPADARRPSIPAGTLQPPRITEAPRFDEPTRELAALSDASIAASLREELGAIERTRIVDALNQCAGNQTQAARLLGMSRNTLMARMSAYGLARPRKPRA
jgi:DNA-binding NtrC family response regulator